MYNNTVTEGINVLGRRLLNIRADEQQISNFVSDCSVVLFKSKEENKDGRDVIRLLERLGEVISKMLGKPLKDGKIGYEVSSFSTGFSVWNIESKNFSGYAFPQIPKQSSQKYGLADQAITLPTNIFNFTPDQNESYSSITSISYRPLKGMILDAAHRISSIGSINIISTSITPKLSKALEDNKGVRITFKIAANQSLQPECVYWDYGENANASWSDKGCHLVQSNQTHVECECNHLTDFSILMTVKNVTFSEGHRAALHFITLIGCVVSILFMIIMVLIIVYFRKLRRNRRYLIHLNLATALILGNISLLSTDAAINNEDACMAVSIIMFYFYMASFFWMLCEGVFIWRAFVTVFTENERFWNYLLLGWGSPIVVVAVTAAIRHGSLTSDKACWLSVEDNTIYAFIGPAVFIILIDSIVLVVTLRITFKQAKKTNDNEIKTMARATLILLPILGMTWLFGVFAVNEETILFKYLFTVLNSLQGFFLFVLYILASKEVQKQFRTIYRRRYAGKFNIKRLHLSHSQTGTTMDSSLSNA